MGGGREVRKGGGGGEGRRGFKPPAVVVETVAAADRYILIYCGGSLRDQKTVGFSCKREGEGVHRERERGMDRQTDRQTDKKRETIRWILTSRQPHRVTSGWFAASIDPVCARAKETETKTDR